MQERQASYKARATRVQESLVEKGLDGMVCFKPQHTFYLSGFNPILYTNLVIAVLSVKTPPVVLMHAMRADHAAVDAAIDDIRLYGMWGRHKPVATDPYEALRLTLDSLGLARGRLGYEANYVPVGVFDRLRRAAPAVEWEDVGPVLRRARMIKDDYEIRMLRLAAHLTDAGMVAAVAHARESEIEASAAAEMAMRQVWRRELADYEVCSFGGDEVGIINALSCYATSGPRVALAANCPNDRQPQSGEVSLPCVFAACDGYHAENERTVIIGALEPERERAYHAMLEARKRALATIQPGATCGQVYEAAVSAFREAGYGDNLPGRVGHGIGLGLHESPSLAPNETAVLQPGMAITVEPGLRFPGWGSVRHSDTLIITPNGPELLTVEPEAGKLVVS